jgi:UDP-N-acetylglucosamine:LPS N-acetylglucosamine transferase
MKYQSSKPEKRILFVCDPGGHYSQMLMLKDIFDEYDCRLLVDASTNISHSIPVKHMKIYHARNHRNIFFCTSLIQCFFVWIYFRPKIIISTGAGIAVPIFIWGKLFGSSLVYIESRARVYSKSATGKIVSCLCNKIIVQWPEMLHIYKNAEYWGVLS